MKPTIDNYEVIFNFFRIQDKMGMPDTGAKNTQCKL